VKSFITLPFIRIQSTDLFGLAHLNTTYPVARKAKAEQRKSTSGCPDPIICRGGMSAMKLIITDLVQVYITHLKSFQLTRTVD